MPRCNIRNTWLSEKEALCHVKSRINNISSETADKHFISINLFSEEPFYYTLTKPYWFNSCISNLSFVMLQVWTKLSSKQFKRGLGNLTKLSYGVFSDKYGTETGVKIRNKQVVVIDKNKLISTIKKKNRLRPRILLLDNVAKNQVKQRAYEFSCIVSHIKL